MKVEKEGLSGNDTLFALALEVFGSEEVAGSWLTTFNIALGMTPLEFAITPSCHNEVVKMLNAIQYGGVI